ncbi:MAG: AtpZ/AtpI family protein [Thermacetogeniaceae bacterium]
MEKKGEGRAAAAWRVLGLMTNIGITMGVSVLIGYYMGQYLDRWLLHKEDSWFTLFFALSGVGAGFKAVFRMINQSLGGGDKE